MVTFALPGEDIPDDGKATPRSRPPLAFSQRGVGASPYGSISKRAPTPHVRKTLLTNRDDVPSSSFNHSYNGARNIFRASTIDSPPAANAFSPSLPNSTMKKRFAPAAGTPGSSRANRESIAQATPRGIAAKAKDKDLFPMRISSPPPELTGAALSQKVPKDWNPKASIYADQFLAHLCPPDLDEGQRRQFFCILDLRRLKYAADEIFLSKGWKLNVTNFAKEFEKTRSIIMLRYGLYEFHNVKPSKEVLKRWRREHGLPDPDEEEDQAEPTPTKATSGKKKRKADGDSSSTPSSGRAKRQATGFDKPAEAAVSTPAATFSKNKRKASVSEDVEESQPAKKPASGARSMFEAARNKATATPSSTTPSTTPATKTSSSIGSKPAKDSLFRSVLTANAEAGQAAADGNNPFAYLSDNSSAKNSGVDADGESESDSDSEEAPTNEQSDEPSAKRPAIASAAQTGTSSDAGTRESTPGPSLFDRVTKDGQGQPVRAATPVETPAPAPPKDQTWNMGTTPIKFAPPTSTTPAASLFGAPKPASAAAAAPTSASSIFAPKSTAPSNIFGASKPDKPAEKEPSPEKAAESADKDGGESDKENDSQGSKKPALENMAPSTQSPFGGSLFGQKPVTTEPAKEPAAKTSASSLFGSSAQPTAASSLFGSASKPAEPASTQPSALQSTTLFGAKPAEPAKEPEKAPSAEPVKPVPAFGTNGSLGGNKEATSTAPTSLFGAKAAPSSAGSLFGGAASSTPATSLSANANTSSAPASGTSAPAVGGAPSLFGGFGTGSKAPNGTSEPAAKKPLFGAPKSPPASTPSMFDGSPMKQDDKSPAKPLFPTSTTSAPGGFSFGGSSQPAPSTNLFGSASKPADSNTSNGGFSFGSTTSTGPAAPAPASGGSSFNFNFGGASNDNKPFNNPFSSGPQNTITPAPASGSFGFGGSSTPSTGAPTFQFGGATGNSNGTPTFGAGSSTPGGTNIFGAGSSQPSAAPMFGGNQQSNAAPLFNLQPPSGGPSTGTSKSPFPGRKILPLKRRT
jgi:hypothetical protein